MLKRRIDRTAATLSDRLRRAAETIPTIRAHLNDQRSHLSTLRVSTGNERTTGSHSDPVGRLVLQLQHLDNLEGYIDDALASITVGANLLDEACRNALGHRTPDTPTPTPDPICHIAGCHDPVGSYRLADGTIRFRMGGDYAGLCDRHRIATIRQRT